MINNICIFEDDGYKNLHPLSYLHPVFDLRTGILSLKEKIEKHFADAKVILKVRDYLAESVKSNHSNYLVNEFDGIDEITFINGRIIINSKIKEQIEKLKVGELLASENNLLSFKSNLKSVEKLLGRDTIGLNDLSNFKNIELQGKVINYPWELVNNNAKEIISDFDLLVDKKKSNINCELSKNVSLLNEQNIFIGKDTTIKPGVVIDATDGPIYIGNNVKIFPNAVIQSPCFIGDNSQIKIGAKIYEGTSIGEFCKVAGEVEGSIVHSYANKQHEGFLGHSYIAPWCNLGADTNTSDLKNNYSNVKVFINDEQVDTGSMFIGLIMGDHSKSAINTQFNTGTVVGISSNVFASDFPPKYIPSFSWVDDKHNTTYDLDKSKQVAGKVMQRRKEDFTEIDDKLFDYVYELTSVERKSRNMPG